MERGARHHVGPDTEILFVIPHPLQPRILSHLHDTENPGKSQEKDEEKTIKNKFLHKHKREVCSIFCQIFARFLPDCPNSSSIQQKKIVPYLF